MPNGSEIMSAGYECRFVNLWVVSRDAWELKQEAVEWFSPEENSRLIEVDCIVCIVKSLLFGLGICSKELISRYIPFTYMYAVAYRGFSFSLSLFFFLSFVPHPMHM